MLQKAGLLGYANGGQTNPSLLESEADNREDRQENNLNEIQLG